MNLRDEVLSYFDVNGFMGKRPGSTPGEEGNPEVETGLAYLLFRLCACIDKSADASRYESTILKVTKELGRYNKKILSDGKIPDDEIAHDDLIGIVTASEVLGTRHRIDLYTYGVTHGWKLSNVDTWYWDAIAKPWQIAFYMLMADAVPSFWEKLSLLFFMTVDSFTSMGDISSKRVTYMMVMSVLSKDPIVDLFCDLWLYRTKRFYGSIQRMMAMYYNNPEHVFVKYWPE